MQLTTIIFRKEAKMKNLILIFGCLLLFIPCQAVAKQPEQKEQNRQQLEDIEKYISQRRLEIEDYYRGQLVEISQRAQAEIRMLEVADKAVYAGLAEQAEVAKVVLHIDSFGYQAPWYLVAETERMLQLRNDCESYGDFEDSFQNPSKLFAVAHSQITERKNRILEDLEWEVVKLEQRKQYALTTGLAQLEKQLKEDAIKPKPEATQGLVTGILYSADKPSAAVDHKVVHQGDTIHGVTVVKIFRDKVVFEKKGRGWDQKVQEKPGAYW
jgi:hypothetical protein